MVVTRAVHFGPSPETSGGMQSALRVIRDHSIGADRVTVVPTWVNASQLANARLVLVATGRIAALEPSAVAHFHVARRGAWLRDLPLIATARARGLKVIVTVHGDDFPALARARPRLVTAALGSVQHVICLSEEASSAVVALLPDMPVSIIPNPVAIDADSPSASDTEPVALFAGTIGLRKGVDVLAAAWARLVALGVPGVCRIVGPVDDYAPPPTERLRLEGAVSPGAIPRMIRDARVVVLPSRSEQMPMILTEALAAARPFVATPVGGTPMLAGDHGVLVPVGDPVALGDALARFLLDPALAHARGLQGQEFCRRTRSPEVIDAELRRVYRDL